VGAGGGRGAGGKERFEREVEVGGERVEDATDRPSGFGVVERQRDASLARVGRVPEESALASVRAAEARREPPTRVAARWLDLDHLDAEVDQQTAAEVAEWIRQIEGAEPLQRRRHGWRASSTAPGALTEPGRGRSEVPPQGAPAPPAGARPRRCPAACTRRRGSRTGARPPPRRGRRRARARAWRSRTPARTSRSAAR